MRVRPRNTSCRTRPSTSSLVSPHCCSHPPLRPSPSLAGDPSKASIYLSFQAAGASADKRAGDAEEVIGSLRNAGMDVTNLRDNELAKVRTHAALRCPPLLHVHLCLLLRCVCSS